jgi:replication initiation and membrane attachment protein DnaB
MAERIVIQPYKRNGKWVKAYIRGSREDEQYYYYVVQPYYRKVKGKRKRVKVKAYIRKKKKSPRIRKEDIAHWIHQKKFKRAEVEEIIEAHRGKNAFYKALEDYYNRTV